MTDLSNIPPDADPNTAPEAETELAYYNTETMLWTAENLIKKLRAAEFPPGRDGQKLLTFMVCRARNVARDFLEMEFYNLRTYLKDKMLRCRRWRMAVLRALGGERGLTRWDARKALARQRRDNPSLWPEADAQDNHDIHVPPTRSLEAPDKTTEPEHPLEVSIFRLARIKAGRNPNVSCMPIMALRSPGPRTTPAFHRIEVTPEELRHGRADVIGRTDVMDIEDADYLEGAETDSQGDETTDATYINITIKAHIDRAVGDYRKLMISLQKAMDYHLGQKIIPP